MEIPSEESFKKQEEVAVAKITSILYYIVTESDKEILDHTGKEFPGLSHSDRADSDGSSATEKHGIFDAWAAEQHPARSISAIKLQTQAKTVERLSVTLVLRRARSQGLEDKVEVRADPADMALVRQFAYQHGLAVVREDAIARTIVLSGTEAQVYGAFAVEPQLLRRGGPYRGRTGPIHLPDQLHGVVTKVLGIDD